MAMSLGFVVSACSSSQNPIEYSESTISSPYGATASLNSGAYTPVRATPSKSPSQLYEEANVKTDYIAKGKYGRNSPRKMNPKYITIHSTQNYSAGAWQHSKALRNGKLRAYKRKGGNRTGYLTWHYTVDAGVAVQHLPTNEQGEHADFDGPGNNYSLAIEMCEHRGNSREETLERTAKLTAWLMHEHDIPLRKVVPHYHWPRKGLSPEHKNCPHFLLDNGHPGAKWQWFLAKIKKHYDSITVPRAPSPRYAPQLATTTSSSYVPATTSPVASIYKSQPAAKPVSKPVVKSTYQPVKKTTASKRYHTVKSGDTLYRLSLTYKTSVSAIQKANGLSGTVIVNGKRLLIPSS